MITVMVRGSYGTEAVELLLRQMFELEKKEISILRDPLSSPDILIVTAVLAYPYCYGNEYLDLQESILEQTNRVLDGGGTVVFNSVYRFLALRERNHPNFREFDANRTGIGTKIPGTRAREYSLAAAKAAEGILSEETITTVIRNFCGAPDEFELVGEKRGVWYFNNASASIPSHTAMAMLPFEDPITIITGGDFETEQTFPFGGLALMLVSYADNLILYGDAADELEKQVLAALSTRKSKTFLFRVDSIEDAVAVAAGETNPGGAVLFSPAVKSEREKSLPYGERFRKGVLAL